MKRTLRRKSDEWLVVLVAARKHQGGAFCDPHFRTNLKNTEEALRAEIALNREDFEKKYDDWLY